MCSIRGLVGTRPHMNAGLRGRCTLLGCTKPEEEDTYIDRYIHVQNGGIWKGVLCEHVGKYRT